MSELASPVVSQTLNARRLLCPMPVIRTQALIKKMQLGEVLEVICTDPGTMHDIPSWCKMYGHTVLSAREHESEFYFLIEVKHVEEEREAKVW